MNRKIEEGLKSTEGRLKEEGEERKRIRRECKEAREKEEETREMEKKECEIESLEKGSLLKGQLGDETEDELGTRSQGEDEEEDARRTKKVIRRRGEEGNRQDEKWKSTRSRWTTK
ncbi:hypothetical protein TSAR_009699 [Trichomalopsis sarcophagae]|uniref:Uncharacterized protein n=1 Tax=Trichomalopsis sarcophagae TaxID=543379 RepID=A0A232F052_9HYME|nr:hypothetical protein TSAR_009699 [Trichomalopsis sarcophagae]